MDGVDDGSLLQRAQQELMTQSSTGSQGEGSGQRQNQTTEVPTAPMPGMVSSVTVHGNVKDGAYERAETCDREKDQQNAWLKVGAQVEARYQHHQVMIGQSVLDFRSVL